MKYFFPTSQCNTESSIIALNANMATSIDTIIQAPEVSRFFICNTTDVKLTIAGNKIMGSPTLNSPKDHTLTFLNSSSISDSWKPMKAGSSARYPHPVFTHSNHPLTQHTGQQFHCLQQKSRKCPSPPCHASVPD